MTSWIETVEGSVKIYIGYGLGESTKSELIRDR